MGVFILHQLGESGTTFLRIIFPVQFQFSIGHKRNLHKNWTSDSAAINSLKVIIVECRERQLRRSWWAPVYPHSKFCSSSWPLTLPSRPTTRLVVNSQGQWLCTGNSFPDTSVATSGCSVFPDSLEAFPWPPVPVLQESYLATSNDL